MARGCGRPARHSLHRPRENDRRRGQRRQRRRRAATAAAANTTFLAGGTGRRSGARARSTAREGEGARGGRESRLTVHQEPERRRRGLLDLTSTSFAASVGRRARAGRRSNLIVSSSSGRIGGGRSFSCLPARPRIRARELLCFILLRLGKGWISSTFDHLPVSHRFGFYFGEVIDVRTRGRRRRGRAVATMKEGREKGEGRREKGGEEKEGKLRPRVRLTFA